MKISEERILAAQQETGRIFANHLRMATFVDILSLLPNAYIEWIGEENIPQDRPVVIAASHKSSYDSHTLPYAYLRITGRPLSTLAKEELYEWPSKRIPLSGKVLSGIGTIAISRNGNRFNREGYATASARLAAGNSIAVFSESKRTYGRDIAPIDTGAFTLAERAGVEVLVAGIYAEDRPRPIDLRPVTLAFTSLTNPAEIEDKADFYRSEIQHAYDTATAMHYGRSLPFRR